MQTEKRNPKSRHLDRLDSLQLVRLMNGEDSLVAAAVGRALKEIARAVDGIWERLESEGRLFYIGAGTSGRMGVMDAVELPPTFGVDPALVQAVLAGGNEAAYKAVESAEDDPLRGQDDLKRRGLSARDALVAITASGRTPYTVGGARFARRLGAFTVGISCNRPCELAKAVDVSIEVPVGPEVITGSTRLKAGTAQKMILNMISTATMVRLGHVYGNLMVNLNLSNRKLIDRGIRIISQATGVTRADAEESLKEAGDIRSAIVMLMLECPADEARGLVAQSARVSEILRMSKVEMNEPPRR